MNETQTSAETSAPAETANLRPTKKQKELLAFIEAFITEHGYSPSYREIMNGLQYTSVATVALHVGNLIKRGHLRKRDHSARSLEVVTGGSPAAAETPIRTNGVKAGDEKWLVTKVEQLFTEIESLPMPETARLDDLHLVLGALRVLGLEGASQSFMERLAGLRSKLTETTTTG